MKIENYLSLRDSEVKNKRIGILMPPGRIFTGIKTFLFLIIAILMNYASSELNILDMFILIFSLSCLNMMLLVLFINFDLFFLKKYSLTLKENALIILDRKNEIVNEIEIHLISNIKFYWNKHINKFIIQVIDNEHNVLSLRICEKWPNTLVSKVPYILSMFKLENLLKENLLINSKINQLSKESVLKELKRKNLF